MPFTTYAELQTAIANALDRSNLTNEIIDSIALFEAKINRKLAVREQVTSATITMSSGVGTLPTDYLRWKRVRWQGSAKRSLKYVTPSFMTTYNPTDASADAAVFTIYGTTIEVAPVSDTSLSMLYAQKVPPLATTSPNWLLTAHPDVYLYGSLVETAAYITSDAGKGQAWNVLANERMDEIFGLGFWQHGELQQRTERATP